MENKNKFFTWNIVIRKTKKSKINNNVLKISYNIGITNWKLIWNIEIHYFNNNNEIYTLKISSDKDLLLELIKKLNEKENKNIKKDISFIFWKEDKTNTNIIAKSLINKILENIIEKQKKE